MLNYKIVKLNDIKDLAGLASSIWHEYWTSILTPEQIDYMVEKFQSEKAIKHQYEFENYKYYYIQNNGENIGYYGLSDKKDYLFLSKLYIRLEFRHQGIGGMAFNQIKETAIKSDFKSIRLTVNKYNKNTIAAYKKWGFTTIDAVVTDIGGGFVMDDYIMEYKL